MEEVGSLKFEVERRVGVYSIQSPVLSLGKQVQNRAIEAKRDRIRLAFL